MRPVLAERNRAQKRWRHSPTPENHAAWRAALNTARGAAEDFEVKRLAAFSDELADDVRDAPRRFWQRFKRECMPAPSTSSPPLQRPDGSFVHDTSTKAAVLNAFFAGVSSSRTGHAKSCQLCRPDPSVVPFLKAHAEDFTTPCDSRAVPAGHGVLID